MQFDSEALWALHRINDRLVYRLHSPIVVGETYRIAIVEPDMRRGTVFSLHPVPKIDDTSDDRYFSPLEFPLAELLMSQLLARNDGLMVHACGIDLCGEGILFCGHSGHGKTTMSRLWLEAGRGTLLNDDRIILRRVGGAVWMFGTPWHGDLPHTASHGVPLRAIFVLRHGESNRVTTLDPAQAGAELLARCFVPHWDRAHMDCSAQLCADIATSIPCSSLAFRPDTDVVRVVQCAL